MDEHDDLEPTVAMPRVDAPPRNVTPPPSPGPAPDTLPPQPAAAPSPAYVPAPVQPPPAVPPPPTAPSPPVYVFGNAFAYVIRRFLAFALDIVLVTAVATMLLYGFIAINPLTGLPSNSERGFDATFALGLAVALLYLWVFEAMAGTTLGKLAFSLHVFAPRGRFVGLGRAFVRNLLRPVDALVIGWILALLPGHRRLGDLFAGTVVARSPLRAFAPLVGWVFIILLAGLPFVVAGGVVTVLAVGAAFWEFIPHLVVRAFDFVLQLFGGAPHPAPPTTAS